MNRVGVFALFVGLIAGAGIAAPPTAKVVEVKRIWDQAPHCAFTDLTFWNNQFVCAFREGRAHVSTDGRIRILKSKDGKEWKSAASLDLKGFDLRDAGLSTAPDGRLMLIGGASPRPTDKDLTPTGAFVSFSKDATNWTKPKIVSEPGHWLWRVTWHEGKAYGILYEAGYPDRTSTLLVSDDGVNYKKLVPKLLADGRPTEAVIRFDDQSTMYCLQRRDGQEPTNTAKLGVSKPPYTQWQWHDLGKFFGGPNFIRVPSGHWIAAGRIVTEKGPKTMLAELDVEAKTLTPFLELPSGGDNSYPGLLWHDDMLWMSYYSSHEGKANIYLAKVKLGDSGKASQLTDEQSAACRQLGLEEKRVAQLTGKPLFQFKEAEVDEYLRFLSATEPDLRNRIVHLARKNIGQPYELYLLGEMPFEPYDPQPLYCLGKSDCVVFAEHAYAMALSHDWPSFMKMLQRIRYRDGQLGVATRNHYTEADWNVSNRWLVEDITASLAGDKAMTYEQTIDRAKFLKNRYKLNVDVPVQQHKETFIPFEAIERAKDQLQDGDFVNIVRGVVSKDAPPSELRSIFGGNAWVGHVGMIVHGENGEVHLIHSTPPRVKEEPLDEYIARSTKTTQEDDAKGKARLLGFKFLRLREDPMNNLREIDGNDAPKVTRQCGEILKAPAQLRILDD